MSDGLPMGIERMERRNYGVFSDCKRGDSHGHLDCIEWVYGDGYYAKCECPCHPEWPRKPGALDTGPTPLT